MSYLHRERTSLQIPQHGDPTKLIVDHNRVIVANLNIVQKPYAAAPYRQSITLHHAFQLSLVQFILHRWQW